MPKQTQKPEVTEEDNFGSTSKKFKHPAFGQARASRVQGQNTLYGSDFVHQAYVILEVTGSEMNRDLSHDWYYPREQKIGIAMSEAQWSTLVSSLNFGSGVPCTIERFAGQSIPGIELMPVPKEKFSDDMRESFEKTAERLEAMMEEVESLKLSKVKTEKIKDVLGGALQLIRSNAGYVADSFDKHMETTTEAAKSELHGYVTHALNQAGLQAVGKPDLIALPPAADEKGMIDVTQDGKPVD